MLERLFLQVEIGHSTRCWLGGASGFSLGTRGLKKNKLEIEIFLIKKKKKNLLKFGWNRAVRSFVVVPQSLDPRV
jgi:hypothetical protein